MSNLRKPITQLRGGAGFFDNGPFLASQKIFFGINGLGYLLNLCTSSHYHVDLLGTGAFCLAALPALQASNLPRVRMSAYAVMAWSTKLAAFLFYRVIQNGSDARLDEILSHPVYAAGFWTYSLLWGCLCSLPHTIGSTSKLPGSPIALGAGAVVFGAGWIMETLADYQKWNFKKTNPGQFCDVGVWSISQHPNWFGNLLIWTGIFIMNAPAMIEPVSPKATLVQRLWSYRRVGLALLSPMFMWNLFDGQATGRILGDGLQATRDRYGYGTDPDYTKYIDTTPLIIPNPFKWFS